jgi:ribosomal protein L31
VKKFYVPTVATGSTASRLRSKLEVSATFYPVYSGNKSFVFVISRASGTAHKTYLKLRVIQAAERER